MTKYHTKAIYKYTVFVCCGLTVVLASMAIAGWITRTPFLAALSNEHIPMAPSTAICFLLISIAISLETSQYREKTRYLITALPLFVALFCGFVFFQFAAALALDIESVLLIKREFRGGIPLGRMSPLTSATMVVVALAVLLLVSFFKTTQKIKDLGGILGSTVCFIGFVLFLEYVYGSPFLHRTNLIPVAITTSMAFMLIGASIAASAGPERLPLRLCAEDSTLARLLRSFLPVLFLSMVLNGAADILVIKTIKNTSLAIAFSTIAFFLLICVVLVVISRNVSRMLDRSREAQRESEQRFRVLFEQAAVGVAQVNTETGQFVMLNDKYCDIVGYSHEEMEKLTFPMITHPDDLQADLDNMQLLQEGKIREFSREKRYIHKNGSIVWVNMTVSPMWESGEKPGYHIAVVEDITERKQAESGLAERTRYVALSADVGAALTKGVTLREMLQGCTEAIVEHLDAAFARIWVFNSEVQVLELQASAGMYTHIDGNHGRIAVGKFKIGLIALERQPHITNSVIGDPQVHDQEWAKREGIISFAGYPLIVENKLVGVMGLFSRNVLSDTTLKALGSVADSISLGVERKLAEKALLENHEQLEKAYNDLKSAQSRILQQEKMASIGQLAAGIAHEINNPTGFIMSNLGSLRKYTDKLSKFIKLQSEAINDLAKDTERQGTGEAEILKKLDETKRALKIDYILDDMGNLVKESFEGADRVKMIVQDLKIFSHIDVAAFAMADINKGLESTINIVWNELKYKATVRKEYGDIPLTKCNPGQLSQVFMNILVNAAQAIEKEGMITIKTYNDESYIYISISDTGGGIPEENVNRIFEPFFTTKEVGKGTGLGLSIAYDIVKKHNGEINVQSEIGRGTTFTIKIPIMKG
jgi:PAS domain S-box-containing protein